MSVFCNMFVCVWVGVPAVWYDLSIEEGVFYDKFKTVFSSSLDFASVSLIGDAVFFSPSLLEYFVGYVIMGSHFSTV